MVLERYVCDSQRFFFFLSSGILKDTHQFSLSATLICWKTFWLKILKTSNQERYLKMNKKKRMIESEKNVINRIVSNCIFFLSVFSPSLWLQEKASGCFWKMVINGNVVEPCWPPPLVLENSNKCLESWTSAQTTCWRAWTKRQRAARHWTFMSKH